MPRIALVGIGNELAGDDVAGVVVAREFQKQIRECNHLLVVEGGAAPENCTGILRRFRPDFVLFVDAAQLGESAGSIYWLEWQATVGLSAFTHIMPPYVLAKYLVHELNCQVGLLGIEPESLDFGNSLSESVSLSIERLVPTLLNLLVNS